MTRGTLMQVPAKDLQRGDFTLGSKQRVLVVENNGLHIPPGKVRLTLRRESGRTRTALWNRSTLIGIEHPADSDEICRTCAEPYPEAGDSYDGKCGSCADKAAAAEEA